MATEITARLSQLFRWKNPTTASRPYSYHKLSGQYMIRLLELQPAGAQDSDELVGRLIHTDLRDGPSFEAISYTWGAPIFDHSIQFPNGYLMVTENLAAALRRFRSIDPSTPRLLWADQVCINQADTLERNQQVSIMGDIYQKAERAFVWLGPGDDETHAAVAMLMVIASSAESCGIRDIADSVVYFPGQKQSTEDEFKALERLASTTDSAKLKPLFEKPWFTRMWICQEVALPGRVDFFCGDDQISFHDFSKACSVINRIRREPSIQAKFPKDGGELDVIYLREVRIKQGKVHNPTIDQSGSVNTVKGAEKGAATVAAKDPKAREKRLWVPAWSDTKFLDYVASIGRRNLCADDRDRVYAFISLQSDDEVAIKPDYRKSVGAVYAGFARSCLAAQDVRILHFAGLGLRSKILPAPQNAGPINSDIPDLPDLPSWAPDWRARARIHFGGGNKQIYTASARLKVLVRTEECNPCIELAGVLIGLIEAGQQVYVGGFDPSRPLDFSFEPSRKSILGIRAFLDSHGAGEKYPSGEERLTAFARTVVADLAPVGVSYFRSLLKEPENPQELVNLWLLFEKVSIKPNDGLDLDQQTLLPGPAPSDPYSRQQTVLLAWIYMLSLSSVLENRQFFITRKNYMGLAPAMARSGDVIALIGGCQAPFVLRPDREKRIFRIVGECYLHGFMNGELLTDEDRQSQLTFTVY